MQRFVLFAAVPAPEDAPWARWLRDVMSSWPVQLVILLLWAGLALLLVRHARREWEGGLRNGYLDLGLVVAFVFFVAQFLIATGLVGGLTWPALAIVVEVVVLFALWLYAFVRSITRPRRGEGDAESRARGAALDAVIRGGSRET